MNHTRGGILLRIFAAALIAFSANAVAQGMEPGEWQFDVTMTSPMMPKPQASTFTRCMKPEDTREPGKILGQPQQGDCTVIPGAKFADSFSWELSCPKTGMHGKGSVRYGRGTLESEMQMAGEMQGRKFDMTTKTSGKRLGPCKS
jgi:hypothetical protein